MFTRNVKPPPKSLNQKGEVSPSKKKPRLRSKSRSNSCKANPENSSNGKISADVPLHHSKDVPLEDPHYKLQKMKVAPGYPEDKTQDFIKFREKKNSFSFKPERNCHHDSNKTENIARLRRIDPKLLNSDTNNEKRKRVAYSPDRSKTIDKPKRMPTNTDASKIKATTPSEKQRNTREYSNALPTKKSNESQRLRTFSASKNLRENEPKPLPSHKTTNSKIRPFSGENTEETNNSSTCRPPQRKRTFSAGRSEIPLRKYRTDLSRHPKPISLLMQKPLNETDSIISIDLFSKKPFSPIEELSLSSDIRIQNMATSSEKDTITGMQCSPNERYNKILAEELSKGFKLDRCYKSPNIPVISNPSVCNINGQEMLTPERSKTFDENKVRTSSFTILRLNREVLSRLESFHQQNVSTKENIFGVKSSSSKLKFLTPNPSFNFLKKKCSKKNLPPRSSSKGNKPGLRAKANKSKKNIVESSKLPKPQKAKSKTFYIEIKNKVMRSKTCVDFDLWNDEDMTEEDIKPTWKLKDWDSTSKSSLESKSQEKQKETTEKELNEKLVPNEEFEASENESSSPKSRRENIEEIKSNESITVPPVPPHTPEKIPLVSQLTILQPNCLDILQADEDERSSSKTVTLGEQNRDEISSMSSRSSHVDYQFPGKKNKINVDMIDLIVKGTPLKISKDEPPEKPKDLEQKKNKLHIKIDLTSPEDTDCDEENINSYQPFDWLYLNKNKYSVDQPPHEGDSNDLRNSKEGKEGSSAEAQNFLSIDNVQALNEKEQFGSNASLFALENSPFSKSRLQYKISGANLKGIRKKIRSNAGDRGLPCTTGFFKSVSLQNKLKMDKNFRSELTKSYIREEKRDMFNDTNPIKLKRRNSEPISFRGYIWKQADSFTPKGLKASVSSMASSLKHLNTDDIDDFTFWEAVPQKMTSCWEMSLYQFKRPWSVLSCSVFEDNRQSSTPGLILENLRNGGSLNSRRSEMNSTERAYCPKENPFDVEPSIAQKNIDIRNWLAALNFPTPPSTSSDVIREGIFSSYLPVHAKFDQNKCQVNQKRRRILTSLKTEEATEKRPEEKENKLKRSTKWKGNEVRGLMDLIRRKSGGFVTNEQFLNSDYSLHQPNITVNMCLCAKAAEAKLTLVDVKDRNVSPESKTIKTIGKKPANDSKDPSIEVPTGKYRPSENVLKKAEEQKNWTEMLERELKAIPAELNIWKYLFLFTIFVISVHYCFLNNALNRS